MLAKEDETAASHKGLLPVLQESFLCWPNLQLSAHPYVPDLALPANMQIPTVMISMTLRSSVSTISQ